MLKTDFSLFPVLESDRLRLRRITQADAEAIFFLRSDENAMRYIDKERAADINEAVRLINVIEEAIVKNEAITWALELKDGNGELAGAIGFWRIIKEHFRAEIGYTLHPGQWGKGIMSEALKMVIEFGFRQMQLHSIEAHINPGNTASAVLLEKSGFVREGYFREDYYFRGKFLDTAVYTLLERDHKKSPAL